MYSARFLVWLLVVTPVCMVTAVRKPFLGILATMMMYYFRPGIWNAPGWFQPVFWITLCTIAGWALKAKSLRITPMLVTSIVLIVGMLVTSANAWRDPKTSYDCTVVIIKLVIVQFLIIQLVKDTKELLQFLWANVIFNLWTLKSVVVITLRGGDGAQANVSAAQGGGSNYLAMTFVMAVPLLYFRFLYGTRWEKRIALGVAPFLLYGVMGTGSRGGFLTLVAIMIFLAVRARKKFVGFSILILTALLFVAFTPEARWKRYMTSFGDEKERGFAAQSRVILWDAGMRMFKQSPITGVGHDNFQILSPRYAGFFAGDSPIPYDPAKEGVRGYSGFVCHNTYIQALAEGGLIGAVPFFLLFVMYFYNMYRVRRLRLDPEMSREVWIASQILEGTMWAFMLASIFGSHFKIDALWWYFGSSTALVLVAEKAAARWKAELKLAADPAKEPGFAGPFGFPNSPQET